MDNRETLATLVTQDTERRPKQKNKKERKKERKKQTNTKK
jgi:hypothetical protein